MSENRVTKQTNDGKLVQSLGKYYKSGTSLSLMGVDYRIPALQKMFNEHIAVTSTAEQAHVDLNAAVAAQDESEVAIRPIRRALFNVVKAKFGETSSTLLEFGFKPKKVAEKTAAVKADAAEKATATKAAGGKKAKKKADAAALAATNAASTTVPQATTTAPVQVVTAAPVAQVAPAATTTPASVVAAVAKGGTGS